MKKLFPFIVIVVMAFVLGLLLGGGRTGQVNTYRSKASETTNLPKTVSSAQPITPPNLVGTVTSVFSVNDGKRTVVVNGVSQRDYQSSLSGGKTPKAKNYLIVVTASTKIYKNSPNLVAWTADKLAKDQQVLVYATNDLVTAIRIDIK